MLMISALHAASVGKKSIVSVPTSLTMLRLIALASAAILFQIADAAPVSPCRFGREPPVSHIASSLGNSKPLSMRQVEPPNKSTLASSAKPLSRCRFIQHAVSQLLVASVRKSLPLQMRDTETRGSSAQAAPTGLHRRLLAYPMSKLSGFFGNPLPRSARQFLTFTKGTSDDSSSYLANVTLEEYPNSTLPQSRPMVLSLFVSNSNFTDPILNATISCLANNTGVAAERWGIWELNQFTETMMQAGMFVNVPEDQSDGSFDLTLKDYVKKDADGLTGCVREEDVGLGVAGQFFMAREPEDRADIRFSSVADANGGSSPWIPALIVGLIGLACLVGLIVVKMASSKKRYDPSDYDDEMPMAVDEVISEELLQDRELAVMADGT